MTSKQPIRPDRINDGRRFGRHGDAAYDLLRRLEPGLCLDVGAAIGRATRRILNANPASRVIAFEPFAGNHPHFANNVGDDPRVALRRVAVADRRGTEHFFVPKIMTEDGAGWAKALLGYSSMGHLSTDRSRANATVDVVRLDDEVNERVRLLKIDVQGGELRVLKGASRLMRDAAIDLIHIEFNGSLRVLRFLRAHGYVLFDGAYMAWATGRYFRNWLRPRHDRIIPDWETVLEGPSSMGAKIYFAWPPIPSRRYAPYCAWFWATRLLRSGLQTDLLCVHENCLRDFLEKVAMDGS
ncbi:MAG: FkbM family methyltransferase [Rhizomicrobium sp.]